LRLLSVYVLHLASVFLGDSASSFLNIPSLLIVVGGTIGVVLMQFSMGQFFGAMKVSLKTFFNTALAPEELIETTIDIVRQMMTSEMNLTVERHDLGQKIFKSIAEVAPAMGMIGTLIGLVKMLANMENAGNQAGKTGKTKRELRNL
jgi:chemotaxis protein MotA